MGRWLRKFGTFYSKIIMRYIGIFVFIGLLEVAFGPSGWAPYENMYAISQFVMEIVLPAMLCYGIAETMSEHEGGIAAALAVTGILAADAHVGIPGALLAGTLGGVFWKHCAMPLKGKAQAGLEMLTRNLTVSVCGILGAVCHYFVTGPVLAGVMAALGSGVDILIQKKLLFGLSFVIEPAKVLFWNNSINYGVLIPLGMQQVKEVGSSVLFLLEANPGPGFGVLMALLLFERDRRREYGLGAFVQMIGGIHEIYFPMVLANPWLILPLIAGGTVGTVCFHLLGAGLSAPASPGSILTILLVAGKGRTLPVLTGVLVSAAVSMLFACVVLRTKEKWGEEMGREDIRETTEKKRIRQIGFICDGGMGSSVMGASILRRKLKDRGFFEITVTAHAIDMIPEGLDLLVCQKSYLPILQREAGAVCEIYTVENLVDGGSYDLLISQIEAAEGKEQGA